MKLVFLTCSSKTPLWLESLQEEYKKKIKYFFEIEVQNLGTKKNPRDDKELKILKEGELLLSQIKPTDWVLLCEEGGCSHTSSMLAKQFERWLALGKKRLFFIVGGAYGVSEGVKSRADYRLSIAPFTLNHHLAFAIILEQIYRSITILKGVPYHNE